MYVDAKFHEEWTALRMSKPNLVFSLQFGGQLFSYKLEVKY